MKHEIVLSPAAVDEYRALSAFERAQVRDVLERHLRHQPTKTSRSRIKRLRGLRKPQYRLRTGDLRVFYDVFEGRVEILAIVTKAQAEAWLKEKGSPDEKGRTRSD
jgi:mRNA-degrading endonuclease RelE of RelBE toxin-antitoxin system